MNLSKSYTVLFFALVMFLVGYALLLLAVPLMGFGWHLLHGSLIVYDGWRIPVPKGFYVSGSPEKPTMWRHSLGVPLLKEPFGMIDVSPLPSGAVFRFGSDLEESSRRMIWVAQQEGLVLRSNRMVPTSAGNAFCFEFSKSNGQSDITVRCAIDGTPLLVIYGGDKRFLNEFYSTVRGLSPTGGVLPTR
ncbi:MAG: hypothetical protein WBE13_08200 [Candidatus Acidiferrum sp.]